MRILALAILLTSTYVNAAEWEMIHHDDDVTISFDARSLKASGDLRKAWIAFDWSKNKKLSNPPHQEYRTVTSLQEFNCLHSTGAVRRSEFYSHTPSGGGELVYSYRSPSKLLFDEVTPGTYWELIIAHLCTIRPPGDWPVRKKRKLKAAM